MASLIKTPTKTNPLLARYLLALATRPLLTKCITSGILSFVQEVLASHLAGVPFNVSRNAPAIEQLLATAKVDMRAFKMAIYGFFVSAPMGHYLMGALQKAFAGKTGRASKIGQLAASNLIIAPIQTFVFLSCMAIISGAQTTEAVLARVKGGFRKMITITWMIQPTATLIAQKFIPLELWVPYFNLIGFSLGTFANTQIKKRQVAAAKRGKDNQKPDRKEL